jgi:hypothetical protein
LNVSWVRYPYMAHLRTGYFEDHKALVGLDDVTSLERLPATHDVPRSFSYEVQTLDGRHFRVTAEKDIEIDFTFAQGSYMLCEGVGHFLINQQKARGIIEFGYHQDVKRWERSHGTI